MLIIFDFLEAKKIQRRRASGGDLPFFFYSEADFNIVRPKHNVTIDLDHKQMITVINRILIPVCGACGAPWIHLFVFNACYYIFAILQRGVTTW